MAQAECISTVIRELMSRGGLTKSTSPVRTAYRELVAALASNPPCSIYLAAESDDLDGRAAYLEKLAAGRIYLTAILADTAENIPSGTLDHKYLETAFRDFCAEAIGGIRNAGPQMSEHQTWRAS